MIKRRASQQFLAMQGDRLLGRSFLPTSSPAGKQAAPEGTPPAFGAADLFTVDGDLTGVPAMERAGRSRVWSGGP